MITITVTVRDREGEPDPNGGALFKLEGTLIADGRVVLPESQFVEANPIDSDTPGVVSVDLWENVGPEDSEYAIQLFSGDQEMLNARLSLTASGALEDLL